MTRFRYSSISAVVNIPWVPTKLLTNNTGWTICRLKIPKALRRISPSSESLKATGSRVPHFKLVNTFKLIKYISARSGLVPPQGRLAIFVKIGILAVFRV